MTTVMTCNCANVHQDEIHGQGRRVFNATAKKDPKEYRCTVCGVVKTKGTAPVAKKKGK